MSGYVKVRLICYCSNLFLTSHPAVVEANVMHVTNGFFLDLPVFHNFCFFQNIIKYDCAWNVGVC